MKEKIRQLVKFDWRLFAALCALALIPAIYQTVRTFIVSSNSGTDVFDIIGQMEWFDLINETLQAFLIIPLYSVLNRIFLKENNKFAKYIFKTGLVTFVIYALFSIGVLVYGSVLVKAMNPNEIDISAASEYPRLETIAFMIGIIADYVNVVFVVVGKDRNVYIFLFAGTAMSLLADFILIPNLGMYGIAISNIIVNAVLAAVTLALLYIQKYIKPSLFSKDDFYTLKEWAKIGVFSGMQQFIDNFVYAIMICKMVNAVAEQGNYWLANNFIWGWLLIPVTALCEVIRRDCGRGYAELLRFNYRFVAVAVVALWGLTVPLWPVFFRYAENLPNADEIFSITLKLAPFYIAYIGSAVIDNIFIGLGKTIYNMINSLIINLIYYGIFFILYMTGTIVFSMDTVILMFGFGMVAHFAISWVEEKFFLRKNELKKEKLTDLSAEAPEQ